MVPAQSPIARVADLKGRKLAVAGGPIDKSWLLLQAQPGSTESTSSERRPSSMARRRCCREDAAGRDGCDIHLLELLRVARRQGNRRAIAIDQVPKGSVRRARRDRRLHLRWRLGRRATARPSIASSTVTRQAKEILASSEPNGSGSRRSSGSDRCRGAADLSPPLWRRHRAPPLAEEEADARALYQVLAEMAARSWSARRASCAGTFYRPRAGSELGLRLVSLALFIAAWVAGSWVAGERLLPARDGGPPSWPKRVPVRSFLQSRGDARACAMAFAIAMTAGSALGLLMGRLALADRLGDPWLVVLLNLPALVIIVLAYVWGGLTETAAILAVAVNKLPNATVTIREGARAARSGARRHGAGVRACRGGGVAARGDSRSLRPISRRRPAPACR